MTIEEKINSLDLEIAQIKIFINSNYPYIGDLYDKRFLLKTQMHNLIKQKERQKKLNKINEHIR